MAEAAETDRAVLVIMTDGYENASRVATQASARRRLDHCRERGWQVVFLGVDFDPVGQAGDLGATADQVLSMTSGHYSAAMAIVARLSVAYAETRALLSFTEEQRLEAVAAPDPRPTQP